MNKLLQPKVKVVLFEQLTLPMAKKVLALRKQRKYGFKDVAYELEELENGLFNVRMEYIA